MQLLFAYRIAEFVSLVDGISINNHMAKHRNAVSDCCRDRNVASACNAGGSSSLHTTMNAAARLMQPLRCRATHLKISHRFLQHASNTQRSQALARQAQRTVSQQHSTRAAAASGCRFIPGEAHRVNHGGSSGSTG